MPRVLLGLSGGVDSSVAAWRLQGDGHDVVAVTLRLCDLSVQVHAREQAAEIAAKLGIEHHVVDARDAFEAQVRLPLAQACCEGLAPDPCPACTATVKIPLLFEAMREYGCDRMATGHYARIAAQTGGEGLRALQLMRSRERAFDQSWQLYRIGHEYLTHLMFPLEDITEFEVRKTAMRAGLMIPQLKAEDAPCLLEGMPLREWAAGQPECPPVPQVESEPLKSCLLEDVVWTSIAAPAAKRSCKIQLARHSRALPCQVTPLEGNRAAVDFNLPTQDVAFGRDAVLYSDDMVLGGGVCRAAQG